VRVVVAIQLSPAAPLSWKVNDTFEQLSAATGVGVEPEQVQELDGQVIAAGEVTKLEKVGLVLSVTVIV